MIWLWTVGASINVEGFERGEVSFQCQHKFARKNHKYLCKDPCKVSDDILVTVESGRRAESGDITLVDSGDGAFTVTFSQLQLSDSGIYWCGVDRPGFDTYTEVQLTVKKGKWARPHRSHLDLDLSSHWHTDHSYICLYNFHTSGECNWIYLLKNCACCKYKVEVFVLTDVSFKYYNFDFELVLYAICLT